MKIRPFEERDRSPVETQMDDFGEEIAAMDPYGTVLREPGYGVEFVRQMLEEASGALAWNKHQSGVTATLAGSRNPMHVSENAEAASIELTDAQLAELDALIPLGPTFG